MGKSQIKYKIFNDNAMPNFNQYKTCLNTETDIIGIVVIS